MTHCEWLHGPVALLKLNGLALMHRHSAALFRTTPFG
jgi:hypothetical protein